MRGRSVGFLVCVVFLLLFILLKFEVLFLEKTMVHSESDMHRICLHHCSLCTVYILLISFISRSLVGNVAASVCSTQHLETVYFYLSPKSMGRRLRQYSPFIWIKCSGKFFLLISPSCCSTLETMEEASLGPSSS